MAEKDIAEYFRCTRLNRIYKGSKEKLLHANETLKMFSALTGDDSFEKVYNEGNFSKKGGVTMCEAVERIRNEGKKEIIKKLIKSNAGSIEQIAAWVELPVEDVQKMAKKVPVKG